MNYMLSTEVYMECEKTLRVANSDLRLHTIKQQENPLNGLKNNRNIR